jgi:acyl-CoA thioesterase YciA
MSESLVVPSGEPVIRTIAMPADTNPAGDIFGGWLMAQMDLAALPGPVPLADTMHTKQYK